MISRAAENCYWLARHIERIESTVKFLHVNQDFVLDTNPDCIDAWYPFIIVAGQETAFCKKYNGPQRYDPKTIQDYLCWERDNPHAIVNALSKARENCRINRDIISSEMWECINIFWLWLNSDKSKTCYANDRHEYYQKIKFHCELFQGLYDSTLLREEPYYFIKLGLMLERASQTARIIDIKYHRSNLSCHNERESALETIQWLAVLKCCSASEAYLKRSHFNITRQHVANFLILEDKFPRTVLYCLTKAKSHLKQIFNGFWNQNTHCLQLTSSIINQLENSAIETILNYGLHQQLTQIINKTGEISEAIQHDLFSPQLILNNTLREQAQ